MISQHAATRELWRRGNLSGKLHEAQVKIHEALRRSTGKLFVCNCARQFGKSYAMVCWAIEFAIKNPGCKIKYATAFLSDLEEFILPNFETIFQDCPSHLRPSFKANKSKFVFSGGSEIKLVGLDKNPNGLRGNTIDLIILDECGFIGRLDYLYKSVIVPATARRPNAKIVMISTPPSTPAHAFADYAQRAESEGNYVLFTIYDNPMLTAEMIEDLKKEAGGDGSTTWKREYLCLFVTDEDSQIIPEWKDVYVKPVSKNEFYRFYHKYLGMDLGVKDFTVVLFGFYDFKRATLVIEKEIKLNGPSLTTLLLKNQIEVTEKELWGDPNSPEPPRVYRRISDNNNLQLIQDLAILHRLSFIPTDKESLEAMINELRIMVNKGQIEVDPGCKQLIGCLRYGVWDKKKKKFARSTVYGHFDALAALIYLVRNLDKHSNPVPATYGFDLRNSRIKIQQHNSEGAKLMRSIFTTPTKKPTY